MRLVLDTSVAVKWFVPEEYSDVAWEIFRAYRAGVVSLVAPEVVEVEFGHTLRKLCIGKKMSHESALAAWKAFGGIGLDLVPNSELGSLAPQLALDNTGTFYDALYVALAVENDLRVITADQPLVNAFATLDRAIHIRDFSL